jgi:hypothetical protein
MVEDEKTEEKKVCEAHTCTRGSRTNTAALVAVRPLYALNEPQ